MKITPLFFALLLAVSGMAQTISFDLKPEGRGTSQTTSPRFVGYDGERVVVVEETGLMKKKLALASYSNEEQELARVELGSGKELECYGGYINGQYVDLLNVTYQNEGMRVYRDRRDLKTLQPAGEQKDLVNYSGEKGDKFGFGMAVSPNQKLLAGVFVANRAVQGTDVYVGLYDHELEEYWKVSTKRLFFDNITVTDDGEVILYTMNSKGYCKFTILDGEKSEEVEFNIPTDDMILDHAFVRYGDGNIIVSTAVRQENHTVMPIGSNIDRVDIYCYNIQRKKLNVERHPMTDMETLRLSNDKETKKPKHHWVQFGQIAQTMSDKDGGYVMIDQTWHVTVDGTPTEQHRMGMMVIRVNKDGKIQWTKTHRMNSKSIWKDRHLVGYRWLNAPDGIMLAWVDHAKNVTIPDDKPVNEFWALRRKGALTVWTLTPDGRSEQSYILVGSQSMAGAAHYLDTPGEYLVLLHGSRKGQLGTIKIEK